MQTRARSPLACALALSALVLAQPLHADEAPPLEAIRERAARHLQANGPQSAAQDPATRVFDLASLRFAVRGSQLAAREVWAQVARSRYAHDADRPGARRAMVAMFEGLRTERIAFFPRDVREMAANPEVARFLDALTAQLVDPNAAVDLFALTLAHVGGDEAEAVRWLAVLFQDFNTRADGPLHLVEDPATQLRWTMAIFALEDLGNAGDPRRVHLYPDGIEVESHRLYHYYVPALLAQRLRARGEPQGLAFLAPFVMNTEYEHLTLRAKTFGEDGSFGHFGGMVGLAPMVALDALEIPEAKRVSAVEDIYLGYRGALRGAGAAVPAPLAEVDRGLRAAPEVLLRRLAADARRPVANF